MASFFLEVQIIMTVAEQSDDNALLWSSNMHIELLAYGPICKELQPKCARDRGDGIGESVTRLDDAKRNAPACMHSLPSYAGLALELQASAQSVAASSCRQSVNKRSSCRKGSQQRPR